jgi:hypothetical protein
MMRAISSVRRRRSAGRDISERAIASPCTATNWSAARSDCVGSSCHGRRIGGVTAAPETGGSR